MRKLLITLAMLVLLAGTAYAQETAVRSMETNCSLEADGACSVTIEVQVDFAPDTEDFPLPIAPGAREVSLTGAAYTRISGPEYDLLQLTGSYSGLQKLVVSYRLPETVTDNGAAQTLNLNLLYPAWPCSIANYRVNVTLPRSFDSFPVFTSGYYGDLIDNYMEISIEEGTIHAVLNPTQTLKDHETIAMALTLPEGYFDLRFLAGKTARVDRLIFMGFLALAALYWLAFLRNLPILPKRQAMPPEGGNPGEIPYVLTERKPDLALMVVQWASLGYLTIHRNRRGRLILERQIDMDTERKHFEVEVFSALFARSDRCDVRSESYYHAGVLAVDRTRRYWQDRIFDPKAGNPMVLRLLALAAGLALCLACFDVIVASKSWRWFAIVPLTLLGGVACWLAQKVGGLLLRRHPLRNALLGLLGVVGLLYVGRRGGYTSLMLLCVLAQLGIGLLLRCGGKRTREGAAMASEILGYRRFLLSGSSQTQMANLEADPQYFYRVLPFADALQVGKLFAAGFDRTRLEPCDWLDWEGKPMKTAPGFYARYRRLMAGLRGERDPGPAKKRSPGRASADRRPNQ